MEGDHLTQIESNAVLIEKGLVEKGAYTVLGGTTGQLLLLNLQSVPSLSSPSEIHAAPAKVTIVVVNICLHFVQRLTGILFQLLKCRELTQSLTDVKENF
jgi:hypothetical protein